MSGINGIETLQQTALQLKERGNADFKAGHFDKAIEHYSRAIGTTPVAHGIESHLTQSLLRSINERWQYV